MLNKFIQFKMKASEAVVNFNEEYLVKHPTDWDCCGAAVLCVDFGRKTKLKKEMIELGMFSENDTIRLYGKKMYIIKTNDLKHVGHQSISYAETRMDVIEKCFINCFGEDTFASVFVHSWVD